MKAKEHFLKLQNRLKEGMEINLAIANLMVELIEEINTLLKVRNAKSNGAVISIVKELRQKYCVICSLAETQNIDMPEKGFEVGLESTMPEFYKKIEHHL